MDLGPRPPSPVPPPAAAADLLPPRGLTLAAPARPAGRPGRPHGEGESPPAPRPGSAAGALTGAAPTPQGLDIIYEARDLDLPQSQRDGLDQYRGSLDGTKKRVTESKTRIAEVLPGLIEKEFWPASREELRRQVGTLRFDMNTLVSTKTSKADKAEASALKAEVFSAIEAADFAIREKKVDVALAQQAAAVSALDKFIAFVN